MYGESEEIPIYEDFIIILAGTRESYVQNVSLDISGR